MSKILIEFIGHSGLGKSSAAYFVASNLKLLGYSAELHRESIKEQFIGEQNDSDKTPNECRLLDTNLIHKYSSTYDIVVSDTNPFAGYIFGDVDMNTACLEANHRYEPFSKVISVVLLPNTDVEISGAGRKETKVDWDFVKRSEDVLKSLISSGDKFHTISVVLDKHLCQSKAEIILSEVKEVIGNVV